MRLFAISNLPWDSYFPAGVAPPLGAHRRTHLAEPDDVAAWLTQEVRTRLEGEGVGGSPTNVALTFAALGGAVTVVGPVAPDAWGARVRADLARHGVTLLELLPAPARQAHSVAFMEEGGERRFLATMPRLPDGAHTTAAALALAGPGWLTASAYELADAAIGAFVRQTFAAARAAGVRRAFDLADPHFVARHRAAVRALLEPGLDLLFTGPAALAEIVPGGPDAPPQSLQRLAEIVLISRGAEGLRVVHDGRAEDFPAEAAAVRDTTGAGDACLGGCLHALAAGAAVPEAVRQGLAAARRCVGVLGAR